MEGVDSSCEEMATITFTNEPSIAELRETESVYTRAMEYLVADGVKETEARESVCWRRLDRLYQALPDRYSDPRTHFRRTSEARRRPSLAINQTMTKEYQPISRVERLKAVHPVLEAQAWKLLSIKTC